MWVSTLSDAPTANGAARGMVGNLVHRLILLAALAFVAPGTIAALIDGTAPAGITITSLARALPYSCADWREFVG